MTAYLLERSRVAALPRGERCFHIVYQMLAAAERTPPGDVEKPSLKLQGRGTTRDYRYLRHGAPLTPAEAEAHAAGLGRTRDALGALHLGTEVLPKLLRIVSAALALGNVTFRPAGDGSEVQDAAPLIDACALLGLDPDAAADALLSHAKKIGADMIVMAHSPTEAGALRDALATAAYCRLFEWVLREGCEAMEGLARATEAADAARRRRTSSAVSAAEEARRARSACSTSSGSSRSRPTRSSSC